MRLMWVVAVGVAVWPDHALAAACAAPSLPSGQEAAIQAAFEPGPAAPAGLRAGDIAVQRDRLIVAWQGHGDPWVWLVRHEAAATGGVRAGNLVAHLASPCQRHGAVDAASFGGAALAAAATTATCPDGAVEVETAFAARLAVAAGAIRWSCAEGDGDAGSPKVGRLLRDLDERLRVADRPSADAALAALADPTLAAGVDLASRIDLGVALWRHGQRDIAHGHLRPALAAWQAVHTPQPPAATADRWVWVRQAERAAAAMVALGEEARGAAVLNACWQALPSTRGEPACSALAFAAALEHSGHGDDAAEWLDLQIARAEPPEADWLRARIGLASRQDDARAELKTAERAVRAWPRDLDLQDSLATACFRAGQHLRAVRLLEGVFQARPDHPGVLGRLSGVVNDWGRVDPPAPGRNSGWQALRDEVRHRAGRDPNDTVAQFLHGVSLFYDAQFDLALDQMRKVEPRAPREGRVFIYQAMAHLWLGRPVEARAAADRAVTANPHDPDVYYCQSQVWRSTDLPRAIAALERYLALETAPGALHFAKKTERVKAELALMRAGKQPPLWDKPGHYDDGDEPKGAAASRRDVGAAMGTATIWLVVGVGALAFIGGGTWWVRRRR